MCGIKGEGLKIAMPHHFVTKKKGGFG